MRALASLALLVLLTSSSFAIENGVTLDFDDVASGTAIDDQYVALGVTLIGRGNGGPFDVLAQIACVTTASPPNAVTFDSPSRGECPDYNDGDGRVRVEFENPQPRVSIMVTHVDPGTASYLRAFNGEQFLDWRFGSAGPGQVGVPQKIELTRDERDPWITAVEFGAIVGSGDASFDDLNYEIGPVATATRSWSLLKSRF